MTISNFGQVIPEGGNETSQEKALYAKIDELKENYTTYMQKMEFRKAMIALRELWVEGNNYIARNEPWKVVKTDKEHAAVILRTAINLIRLYALLASPIMPETAQKMLGLIGVKEQIVWPREKADVELSFLKAGHELQEPILLFNKISPERIQELAVKYKEAEG